MFFLKLTINCNKFQKIWKIQTTIRKKKKASSIPPPRDIHC